MSAPLIDSPFLQAPWLDLGRAVAVTLIALVAGVPPLLRWRRRPKQGAEKAVGWFVWNWVTGGKLGCGPEMWDRQDAGAVRRRAAIGATRTTGTVAVLVLAWSLWADLGPGGAVLAGAGTAALVPAAVWSLVLAVVLVWHWFWWVVPLHRVLRPILYKDHYVPSWRWLRVPRSRARQEAKGVRVKVPANWWPSEKERDRVVSATHAKLRLTDVTDHWVQHAHFRFLQVRPAHHAPPSAYLSDPHVQKALASMKGGQLLLGLAAGGKDKPRAIDVDLDSEAPHVLLSAGTGGGKSVTIRTLTAQAIRRGWHVWVIDVKRHSHMWIRGLPGVRYFRDPEDIHHALMLLAREGDRRNRAWDDVPFGEQGPTFPRILIVCEEINATANYLRKWWRQVREPGDPAQPESVAALGAILFMGRAVQIHVLAVAQSATAKDLGGPENRENFFCRILARYTANAWKMLVPECAYTPASSHPGRAQVCIAGTATETQQVFMSEPEARDYALAGRDLASVEVVPFSTSHGSSDLGVRTENVSPLDTFETSLTEVPVTGEVEPALMSAAEMSADKGIALVNAKYHALRKALLVDVEAPRPVQRGNTKFYDPEQVKVWARNRPIAGRKEREKVLVGSIEGGGSDE